MQYSRSKNRLNTQPITLCHQNVRECVMREKGAGCVFVWVIKKLFAYVWCMWERGDRSSQWKLGVVLHQPFSTCLCYLCFSRCLSFELWAVCKCKCWSSASPQHKVDTRACYGLRSLCYSPEECYIPKRVPVAHSEESLLHNKKSLSYTLRRVPPAH